MNITFVLKQRIAVLQHREPFPLTEEPVILSFSSTPGDLKNLFIKGEINSIVCAFEASETGAAVLPAALKQCGILKLTIQRIIDGKTYQTWSAEPVEFVEIDGKYTAIPQILNMEARIQQQEEKILQLSEALGELKNLIVNKEY